MDSLNASHFEGNSGLKSGWMARIGIKTDDLAKIRLIFVKLKFKIRDF